MDYNSEMQSSNNKKYLTIALTVLILALLAAFIGYNIFRSQVPTTNSPQSSTPETDQTAALRALGGTNSIPSKSDQMKALSNLGTSSGTPSSLTEQQRMQSFKGL